MRVVLPSLTLLLALACTGGGDGTQDTGDDDDEPEPYGAFESFAPASYAVHHASYDHFVAVTDVPGNTGCTLSQGEDHGPGVEAHRVLVAVDADTSSWCPEGSYGLEPDCAAPVEVYSQSCAVYTAWDEDGEVVARVPASGGSVTFTETDERCEVMIEASFPGAGFRTWSFGYDFGDDPVCVH